MTSPHKPEETYLQVLNHAAMYTLHSYRDFMQQDHFDTAKEFGVHHTSCKAALSHLESILKLQNLCRSHTAQDTTSTATDIETLLQQTRAILSKNDHSKN